MILWTTQDRIVWENLKKNGIHFADIKYAHRTLRNLYIRLLKENYPNEQIESLVWAWQYLPYAYEVSTNDKNFFKKELVFKNEVVLKLNVPDNLVTLTNFYDWCRVYESAVLYPDTIAEKKYWDKMYKLDKREGIQAIFPYLKEEFILEAYVGYKIDIEYFKGFKKSAM